jgi:hypothetical protein
VGYAGLKVAFAVGAVSWFTPGWPGPARVMAAATLVFSLPFLHDVMLGNANVLLVGSMAVALFGSDRPRSGVLLGFAAALFAKPLVVPILLWLLVWRRRVLTGTVLAGLFATAVGALIAGASAYTAWIEALLGGTRFASQFAGNHGVTAIVPELWLPIAAVTFLGLVVVLLRRDSMTGITWASTVGLLIAPYAGTYSALPIALAMPGVARVAPRVALLVAAIAPIATGHLLPVYAGLIILWSLLPGDREPH